ncbi:MAG: sigma-70 family RNA polymerase sigma factor [Verrucomicrobiota bacterium]
MTAEELFDLFAKTRDPGAFAELYKLVYPDVIRSIRRFTYSLGEETIEDIVHDVFFKLLREPEKFLRSNGAAVRPMMVVVAQNLALSTLREKKRQREDSYNVMVEKGIELEREPSTLPDDGPDLPSLEEILEALDKGANKREQAFLREWVDPEHWTTKGKLNPKSLAERQGTTRNTMDKRMSLVRRRVKSTFRSLKGFLATVASAAWNWLKPVARRPEVHYPALAVLGILLVLFALLSRPGSWLRRIDTEQGEAVSSAQTRNDGGGPASSAPATRPAAAVFQATAPAQTNSLIGSDRIVPSPLAGMSGFTISYNDPIYPIVLYIDFVEALDNDIRKAMPIGFYTTLPVSLHLSGSPCVEMRPLCRDLRLFRDKHRHIGVEAWVPGTRQWSKDVLYRDGLIQPSEQRLAMPTAGELWTRWIRAMEVRRDGRTEAVDIKQAVPGTFHRARLYWAQMLLMNLVDAETITVQGDSSGPFGHLLLCELGGAVIL